MQQLQRKSHGIFNAFVATSSGTGAVCLSFINAHLPTIKSSPSSWIPEGGKRTTKRERLEVVQEPRDLNITSLNKVACVHVISSFSSRTALKLVASNTYCTVWNYTTILTTISKSCFHFPFATFPNTMYILENCVPVINFTESRTAFFDSWMGAPV